MTINIEYNDHNYEVYFDVILGSHGDYFNPPEPPEIHETLESNVGSDALL